MCNICSATISFGLFSCSALGWTLGSALAFCNWVMLGYTLLVRCWTWRCLETPSLVGAGPEAAESPFSSGTFKCLVAAGAEKACNETLDPLLDQGLCGGFRARLGSNYLLFKLQS